MPAASPELAASSDQDVNADQAGLFAARGRVQARIGMAPAEGRAPPQQARRPSWATRWTLRFGARFGPPFRTAVSGARLRAPASALPPGGRRPAAPANALAGPRAGERLTAHETAPFLRLVDLFVLCDLVHAVQIENICGDSKAGRCRGVAPAAPTRRRRPAAEGPGSKAAAKAAASGRAMAIVVARPVSATPTRWCRGAWR